MQIQTQTRTKIYTVTQVNSLVKDVLEANLPSWLTIKGEITDWKEHQSGHRYFSLKDEESVLPCAMWRSTLAKIKFKPANGLAVLVTGSIDLYVPQGRYKLIVDEMIPAGMGALQLAFEQMVRKLEAEGLFSEAHKKPLPKYPQRIGILTSESGAAVQDIAVSIHNRWPCTRLLLYSVPVQGPGAAQAIAAGIRDVNRRNDKLKLDVLIVGRGGGSLEDLWAFNEEVLARAIFDSRIPIISAVGHEVDTTVADLVADARASTPTKAGVVAVPDMQDVLSELAHHQRRLTGSIRGQFGLCCEYLQTILASAAFRNPLLSVLNREQYLDDLTWSLGDADENDAHRSSPADTGLSGPSGEDRAAPAAGPDDGRIERAEGPGPGRRDEGSQQQGPGDHGPGEPTGRPEPEVGPQSRLQYHDEQADRPGRADGRRCPA